MITGIIFFAKHFNTIRQNQKKLPRTMTITRMSFTLTLLLILVINIGLIANTHGFLVTNLNHTTIHENNYKDCILERIGSEFYLV